jgi:hypothetical protein
MMTDFDNGEMERGLGQMAVLGALAGPISYVMDSQSPTVTKGAVQALLMSALGAHLSLLWPESWENSEIIPIGLLDPAMEKVYDLLVTEVETALQNKDRSHGEAIERN